MKKIKTIPFTAIFFFVLIVSSLECAGRVFSGLGNDSIFERAFSEVLDNHHFCLRRRRRMKMCSKEVNDI